MVISRGFLAVVLAAVGGWGGTARAKETPTPLGVTVCPGVEFPRDPVVMGLGLGVPWGYFGAVVGIDAGLAGNTVGFLAGGVQATPGVNVSRWVGIAWQVAGCANYAEDCFFGFQTAVGHNQCDHWMNGFQLGAVNDACRIAGVQIGAVNRAKEMSGVQFGVFNQAENASGLQLGIVNKAPALKGVQLGVANFAGEPVMGFLPLARLSF